MNPQLKLEFLRSDPSKIWVNASNVDFSGTSEQYINDSELEKLRNSLLGFPVSPKDEAVFEAGKNNPDHGYCKLRFYCFDSIGHTAVKVSLANEIASNESADNKGFASFQIQFEANELDHFVVSLTKALETGEGIALLKGVRRHTENV